MSYNAVNIRNTIEQIDSKETALIQKFKKVFWAQIVGLLSPIMSVLGSILSSDVISALTFVFLGLAIVILDLALYR